MKAPDPETIAVILGWLAHFIFGRVSRSRRAATLAEGVRMGQRAAAVIAEVADATKIDLDSLALRLRREVERAAVTIGLPPELLDQAYEAAEAELGRILFERAAAQLRQAGVNVLAGRPARGR